MELCHAVHMAVQHLRRFNRSSRYWHAFRATALGLLAAMTISGCGGTKITLVVPDGCSSGFAFHPDDSLVQGNTPANAVAHFLASGSISSSPPMPRVSPTSNGFPSSGWREVKASPSRAIFKSGHNQLVVILLENGHWEVVKGLVCSK